MMPNKYYLKWLVLCGANLLCMALCYLTNWFVVLFADKYGNLPKIFKLWQTYDNCLDVAWMIYENNVPKFARYDFNKHYLYHFESKGDGYMIPGYVDLIDDNFTLKERFQRYVCRCAWLYRNCGYGFAYYIFGKTVNPSDVKVCVNEKDFFVAIDTKNKIFCIKDDRRWCRLFKKSIYLGYKFISANGAKHPLRCMLANRINFFRRVK
jgi:hypothetical protein|nr:MAG TPA: Envelope protein [Caudoviricetes sp.]